MRNTQLPRCCRKCMEAWHAIDREVHCLVTEEIGYFTELVMKIHPIARLPELPSYWTKGEGQGAN